MKECDALTLFFGWLGGFLLYSGFRWGMLGHLLFLRLGGL